LSFDELVGSLRFSLWEPEVERGEDWRLPVSRSGRPDARLIELPQAPVDAVNALLPPEFDALYERLAPLTLITRMSTFAVGALINRAVAAMPQGHSYVNVGTWHGFSLLSGMAGNPDARCTGVDNFSLFGGPREQFLERFERFRTRAHEFHDMGYEDYFANVHEGPVGVYFYDGPHGYEDQLRGLQVAEPFFAEECLLIVDDTNWPAPYDATFDFMAQSEREHTVLLDRRTTDNGHPSFWNGLLIIRSSTPSSGVPAPARAARADERARRPYRPVPFSRGAPSVSVVISDSGAGSERLDDAIAEAHALEWPALEVVVADGKETSLRGAIDATSGDYIGFADATHRLRPSAVRLAFAFPNRTEFSRGTDEAWCVALERTLAVVEEAGARAPEGAVIALANGPLPVPRLANGRRTLRFLSRETAGGRWPPDENAVLERLAALRADGDAVLVLGWRTRAWLERYPRFRDLLERDASRLFETDDGVAFGLRRHPS
jgi:hypothetical protein